jgi:hypothetical protein
LIAGLGVIGSDIAARAIFGAAIADQDLAVEHARCAGDRVGVLLVDQRILFPRHLASRRIERDQAAVIDADVYLALPQRYAAVDHVAAALVAPFLVDLGIVAPQPLAGARVDGMHHAP